MSLWYSHKRKSSKKPKKPREECLAGKGKRKGKDEGKGKGKHKDNYKGMGKGKVCYYFNHKSCNYGSIGKMLREALPKAASNPSRKRRHRPQSCDGSPNPCPENKRSD